MNIKGLTNTEVEERKQKGLINYVDEPKTKTIKEIIKTNALTYFNFLNIANNCPNIAFFLFLSIIYY